MSNGGYKGASPARETSPEQYPGVWELPEQFQAQADGNWPFQADDNAPKGLRLNGSTAFLSRLAAASSNRRTWTMSMWVKRGKLGVFQDLFGAGQQSTNDGKYARFSFMADDTFRLRFWTEGGNLDANLQTTRVFRDCSAFYHFVIRHDSTETDQEDRLRIYVNNELITSYSSPDYLSQNVEGHWNFANKTQMIGAHYDGGGSNTDSYFDGCISEVHHIDGQSLPPEEFAFEDGQGIWQPKRFTGDYSSGPVYSSQTTINDAAGSTFSPGNIFDGDTSTFIRPTSNDTIYEGANADDYVFRLGNLSFSGASELKLKLRGNSEGYNYIWFNDDINTKQSVSIGNSSAGVVTVTSLPSTITAISLAGPDTGTGSFGLSIYYLELDGVILTDASTGVNSFHLDFSDGVKDQSGLGNDWTPNGITLRGDGTIYSNSFTSTATFSANNPASYGFDGSIAGPNVPYVGGSAAEIVWTPPGGYNYSEKVEIYVGGVSGFRWNLNGGGWNTATVNSWNTVAVGSGTITTLKVDRGGSATHGWHAIKIDNQILVDGQYPDFFVDSPVNGKEASTGAGGERRGNYASLNPLQKYSAIALSEGNLAFTDDNTSNGGDQGVHATIMPTSGKFYWEMEFSLLASENYVGLSKHDKLTQTIWTGGAPDGYYYYNNGNKIGGGNGNGGVAYGASFAANDVIGIAADWDNGKITFYKNGSSQGDAFTGVDLTGYIPAFYFNTNQSTTGKINFGQRPYKYQNAGVNRPSADYKPLATSFLPEPTIKRGDEAVDVALWTGNNSINKIENLRLSPDLVWIGARGPYALNRELYDTVRGAGNLLRSNTTGAEASATRFSSFDSDGFTLNGSQPVNGLNETHVGWVWKAGDSTTTIAAGGSNSLAYDQSQTWSGLWTGTTGYGSFTNLHDADDTDYAQSLNATLTFPSSIALTSLKIRHSSSFGTATLSINGTDVTSQLATSGTKPLTTITGFTSLTSISMSGADYQSNVHTLYEIFVNGKKLVDNGVSVTNVPEVECKVRANQTTGFSIIKVDNPTATEGRVHGLSKTPDMVICKSTDSPDSWHTYWRLLGKDYYINLNGTSPKSPSDQFGSQEANSHSFYVKTSTGSGANKSGGMIYYAWHSVEEFSKFGEYTANNSTSGPFVYCGFQPKLVLIWCHTNSEARIIYDTERSPSNFNGFYMYVGGTNTEPTTNNESFAIDIVSNGFKPRGQWGGINNTNTTDKYLFAAWAEHPFSSNCRAR